DVTPGEQMLDAGTEDRSLAPVFFARSKPKAWPQTSFGCWLGLVSDPLGRHPDSGSTLVRVVFLRSDVSDALAPAMPFSCNDPCQQVRHHDADFRTPPGSGSP